jgi:hypothetical protein
MSHLKSCFGDTELKIWPDSNLRRSSSANARGIVKQFGLTSSACRNRGREGGREGIIEPEASAAEEFCVDMLLTNATSNRAHPDPQFLCGIP